MELKNSYIYIPVSDLKRASDWYCEHLSFEVFFEDSLFIELRTATGMRIILITNENHITSHMNYQNGVQAAYGFTVSDIKAVYEQLKDSGIKVGQISEYAGTSFSFHDLDGNVLEFWSDYSHS